MDTKNPLYWVLPAGVFAYAASPEVRQGIRTAVVKGVAGVLDAMEKTEGMTGGLRDGFKGIVDDAERLRKEAREAPTRVEVVDAEPAPA
jgi:hypothetical protein